MANNIIITTIPTIGDNAFWNTPFARPGNKKLSLNKMNSMFAMKYLYGPSAAKIPFGFETVYPNWVPRSVLK